MRYECVGQLEYRSDVLQGVLQVVPRLIPSIYAGVSALLCQDVEAETNFVAINKSYLKNRHNAYLQDNLIRVPNSKDEDNCRFYSAGKMDRVSQKFIIDDSR